MKTFSANRVFLTATLVVGLFCGWGTSLSAQESDILSNLVKEMESVFAESTGMITHTMTVHGYAVDIQGEEGGDPFVVKASALLHDIGIPEARKVHGSSSGQYQEIEGPPIAREILGKLQAPSAKIDHICGIVANHHSDKDPEIVDTIEFKIIWAADWLVNFPGRHREATPQETEAAIEEIFKTKRGKLMARQMFLE